MRNKRDIDRTVAALLGVRERDVSRITGAFLGEVRRLLVEDCDVNVSALGRLRLRRENFNGEVALVKGTFRKGGRRERQTVVVSGRYRVYFSQAEPLREAIKARYGTQEKDHEQPTRRGNGQVRGGRERRSGRARKGRQ